MAYQNSESKNRQQKWNQNAKISQNGASQIFGQRSNTDVAKSTGASQRAKAWARAQARSRAQKRAMGVGGYKDQLWFSPKKKKKVVRWQTVVFVGKISYTVVVMFRL